MNIGSRVSQAAQQSQNSYQIKSGDSLYKIASSQLGPGASRNQIQAFIDQVQSLNSDLIKSQDLIYAGDTIAMPPTVAPQGQAQTSVDLVETTPVEQELRPLNPEVVEAPPGYVPNPDNPSEFIDQNGNTLNEAPTPVTTTTPTETVEVPDNGFAQQSLGDQMAFLKGINTPDQKQTRIALLNQNSAENKLLLFNEFLKQDQIDNLLGESFSVLPVENQASSIIQLTLMSLNPEMDEPTRQAIGGVAQQLAAVTNASPQKSAVVAEMEKMAAAPENAPVAEAITSIANELKQAPVPPSEATDIPTVEVEPTQPDATNVIPTGNTGTDTTGIIPVGTPIETTEPPAETPQAPDMSIQLNRLEELANLSGWNPMNYFNAEATKAEMQELIQTIVNSSDEDVQKMANILAGSEVELLQPLLTNQATPPDAVAKIVTHPDFPVGNFMDELNDSHAYTVLYRVATAGTVEQATSFIEKTVEEYDRFWDRETPIKNMKNSLLGENDGQFWNRLPEDLRKKIDDLLK